MKRSVFRILSASLALSLLLLSCAGCGKDDRENHLPAVLAENGESPYTVVYAAGADLAYRNAANALVAALQEQSGASVEIEADFGTAADRQGAWEILVGEVVRDECYGDYALVPYSSYGVLVTETRVLVLSPKAETVGKAVDWLVAHLVKKDGKLLLEEELLPDPAEAQALTIDGRELTEYTIVTAPDADEDVTGFAQSLRLSIAEATDHALPIVHNEAAAPALRVQKGGETGAYSLSCKDGTVTLTAGGKVAFAALLEEFKTRYLTGKDAELKASDTVSGALSSDVSVMTSNLLFNEATDMGYRMRCLAQTYLDKAPDVLCLQEARPSVTERLFPLIASDYDVLDVADEDGAAYQQILLRKGLFTAEDAGFTRFRPAVMPWGVSWVVLRRNSDQKRFAVLCTHLTIISDTYDKSSLNTVEGVALRQNDCKTILETVKNLQAAYGADLPILLGGDFNGIMGSESLSPLDGSGLLENAVKAGGVNAVSPVASTHPLCKLPAAGGEVIDHWYVSASVKVLSAETVCDGIVIQGSDHCPMLLRAALR